MNTETAVPGKLTVIRGRAMAETEHGFRTPDNELRILILEDVPADAELVERTLRREGLCFSSRRVETGEAFIRELGAFHPDIILADHKLPSFDGLSALDIVKEASPDIPFIFVTGSMGEEWAIETLKRGATDYVLKERLTRLVPAVRRALEQAEERGRRRQAEEKVKQLLAFQAAIRDINRALLRFKDTFELYQEICNLLTRVAGIRMVWIGFVEEVGREVRPVAQSGFDEGYLSSVRVTCDDTEYGGGPTGLAIKTGKPCIIGDLEADPRFEPWKEAALKRGFASAVAAPLTYKGKVLGALTAYALDRDAFGDEETEFLMEAAGDIAVGMKAIMMEEDLRESEAGLANAQRIAHLGNWDWNIQTNKVQWSNEIYRIFGFTPQQSEATYEVFLNSVHPEDRELVRRAVEKALEEGKLYSIDHRIVLPGGVVRIVHEQAEVGCDDSGRPVRMLGTVQDITELKRTEEELRQRVDELERFRKATVQREFRMKELKERVRELEKKVATGSTA